MMNKNVGLKVLVVLIILAVCLISFVGIFIKDKNQMLNVIPNYLLSMNLKGTRVVKLSVDTSTKEVIYDNEGNVTTDGLDEEGKLKEGYTKKDEKVNQDEVLTVENYTTVKEIVEKRLQESGINEFLVKQDTENGEITIELPEATNTDAIISNLAYIGKFTIEDSQTNEVLLDNSNVKSSSAVYGNTDYGTIVYWRIEFNKESKEKLEEITKKYISTTNEEGNTVTNKISIKLDDEQLTSTYFKEVITNGRLELSVGSATSDNETISEYIEETSRLASILNSGKMPIKYVTGNNNYLSTSTNIDILKIFIYIAIVIIAIMLVYLCIKYKAYGIFLSISYIGYVALLLIVFRYTNVIISLESLVVMTAILIINYMFIKYVLDKLQEKLNIKEVIKKTYKRYTSILVPILIIGIVFSFIEWTPIASIGMILFWGLIIMFIYNYITVTCLLKE